MTTTIYDRMLKQIDVIQGKIDRNEYDSVDLAIAEGAVRTLRKFHDERLDDWENPPYAI